MSDTRGFGRKVNMHGCLYMIFYLYYLHGGSVSFERRICKCYIWVFSIQGEIGWCKSKFIQRNRIHEVQ